MENSKKGINAKLIIIIAAVIAVIVAAFFGIRALIPEKSPVNDKSAESTPEVITLPGGKKEDVTAITGTETDKKGIVDKEGHRIYDTGYKTENGTTIYTTGKKDAQGNVLYTLNRTNDVGQLIYYTGKIKDGKLELQNTKAVPDYSTDKNSKLTRGSLFSTTKTVKYEADKEEKTAAAIAQKWITFAGGTGEDKFDKIIAVKDGYVAVGISDSNSGIYKKAGASWKGGFGAVSKIGTDGKVQWTYVTGGNDTVILSDVAQLKDGSIVAVGTTCATDTDAPKTGLGAASLVIKLDKNGEEVWKYAFPCHEEENGDIAYCVAATPDGGFVVGGKAESTTGLFKNADGEYKSYIFKFDKRGNIEWKKTLSGSKDNKIAALAVNDNGDIFATCITHAYDGNFASLKDYEAGGNNANTVVLKLNKKGDYVWSSNLAGWGVSEFDSIAVTHDGGCVVGGKMSINKRAVGSFAHCNGSTDGYIVRYTEDGKVYWARNIGGTEADAVTDVIVTDKGIVVTGTTKSDNVDFAGLIKAGEREGFVSVFNNSGNIVFSNIIGGKLDDSVLSAAPTETGFVICGFTMSSDGIFKDSKAAKKAESFIASYDFSDK